MRSWLNSMNFSVLPMSAIDSETFVQALQSVSFTVVGDYVQFSFRAPAELFLDGIVPPAVTDNLARLVSE